MSQTKEVTAAFNLLSEKYPTEHVCIKLEKEGWCAMVWEGFCANMVIEYGHPTPAVAAEKLIVSAGERSPEIRKSARVAELKAELAQLEGDK